MASLSDDGLMLWERLRNLQFGAEQAQKAGQPEASQVRLSRERDQGCLVIVHRTSIERSAGVNGGSNVACPCPEFRGSASLWLLQSQLPASWHFTG